MKTAKWHSNYFHFLSCAMLLLMAGLPRHSATAADVYWDANGLTLGAGTTPAGIWGTDAFWNPLADGTGTPGAWVAGDHAIFSAGTDAIGAYTVTFNGNQTASRLTIEEGTVSLSGGAVVLGAGNLTVNAGAMLSTDSSLRLTATAGATVTLNGGTLRTTNPGAAGTFYDADFAITLDTLGGTFTHVTSNILNIVQTATTISGPGGLTKNGAGVLAIAGTATYLGSTTITEGEFRIRTNPNRLPVTTAMIINRPGILNLNSVSQRIGSLSGNGDVGLGNGTLTVGDATDTVFSGNIKNVANAGAGGVSSGNGRVSKQGSGSLTFLGTNDFSGSLTNDAGTINVAPDAVLCGAACDLVVNGGSLNLSNTAQTVLSLSGTGGAVNLAAGHTLTVNPSSTNTFAGTVGGAGALAKTGAGTLGLAGNNTYEGGTTVSAGTLLVANSAGSATGTGAVTVASGATLAGAGGIAGPVSVLAGGNLAPGQGIGTLNVGSANLGGNLLLEITKAGAVLTADKVATTNAIVLDQCVLTVTNLGEALAAGDAFDLLDGSLSGSLASLTLPALPDGLLWQTNALLTTGVITVIAAGPINYLMLPTVTNGTVSLQFVGVPGQSFELLRSTNLTTWSVLQTNTVPAPGRLELSDTNPPAFSGFYQLLKVP